MILGREGSKLATRGGGIYIIIQKNPGEICKLHSTNEGEADCAKVSAGILN